MTAQPPEVRHPLFARLCALMSRKEPAEVREHRRELLSGLRGRVLELGAGAGANFGFYPAEVSEVVAVEPEPYLHGKALEAAAAATVRVTVVDGTVVVWLMTVVVSPLHPTKTAPRAARQMRRAGTVGNLLALS